MKKTAALKIFAVASLLMVSSCAKESNGTEGRSCRTQRKSHTGCCSGHGGFGNSCGNNEAIHTDSGKLVCNDGTTSPTCIYKTTPTTEVMHEFITDSGLI